MLTQRRLPALLAAALLALVLAGALAASADAQATRTWVSGVGDDVNPCSRTAPCKTFAGAISKTAARGEINAIDSGGFGPVTVTKSITIDARPVLGGVLNGGVSGVVVNAAPTDDVILRGLEIHGGGSGGSPCGFWGLSGVRVLQARSVRIEDTTIASQQKAIDIAPTAPVDVFVDRVDVSNACTDGLLVAPAAGGSADVAIRDSTFTNAGTALTVGARGNAWLTGSTLFSNTLGFKALPGGTITDLGGNHLIGNVADGTPTSVATVGNGPAGPAGPVGPAGPQGEPGAKLLVTAAAAKLKARAGKGVALRYLATAAADATLTVARKGTVVATVTGVTRAGANTIRWNGRAGRKRAKAGRYVLTLRVAGADGQTASATAQLKLAKRR